MRVGPERDYLHGGTYLKNSLTFVCYTMFDCQMGL